MRIQSGRIHVKIRRQFFEGILEHKYSGTHQTHRDTDTPLTLQALEKYDGGIRREEKSQAIGDGVAS